MRVNLLYPDVMIYKNTEFLVREVSFTQTDSGELTELKLVLPGAYNKDEELEKMPWDV